MVGRGLVAKVVVACCVVRECLGMRVMGAYETELNTRISNGNVICQIVVNEEVTQASFDGVTNQFDNESVNLPITIPSTAESQKAGLYPRGVYIKWSEEPPGGYSPNTVLFLPVFSKFRYQNRFLIGYVGAYLDTPAIIIGKRPETIRS